MAQSAAERPLDDYVDLLQAFQSQGYTFSFFDEWADERHVLLRHDVDFSPSDAVVLSDAERRLGVRATYFFMLSSNFYNPLAPETVRAVEQIKANGSAIGLHFNPEIYPDLDQGFEIERSVFESVFDSALEIVSIHRPRLFLEDNNRSLGGVPHTYLDRFFKGLKYISDSGGSFRFGHPLQSDEFLAGKTIHLNLHAIWWTRTGEDATDRLLQWRDEHFSFIDAEMEANCGTYRPGTSPR